METTDSLEKKKILVQSRFFEFIKMRYLLEKGFGLHLGRNVYVPLQQVSDYINSLLLVDLFSVWGIAVDFIFESRKISNPNALKKQMNVLKENGLLLQADYIKWYIDMRNEIAHKSRKVEFHILNQALDDIKKQLITWGIIPDYKFGQYIINVSDKVYRTGVSIDDIVIIEYKIEFQDQPSGISTSWGETVNLNYEDFSKKIMKDN
jgi:hypothetical protein